MTTTGWSVEAGADVIAGLDAADVELERAQRILRTRTTPLVGQGVPYASAAVLQSIALADEALVACDGARIRLADLRSTVDVVSWSYTMTEQITRTLMETTSAVVATGVGTLLLGGVLLSFASLPMALPGLLVAAGLSQTGVPDLLLQAAQQVLGPLLPSLLNDPAFVDALALAVESADEALAALAGQATPLSPFLSQLVADDESLSSGAGVALALALLATGNGVRAPGQLPSTAVVTPTAPATREPVDSYATAFDHLSSDGPAIEVQRYEHPDGSVTWQVFARGTESFGIDDPQTAYDLTANIENAANASGQPLVGSAAAVEQALLEAGATSDDAIQMFGYSQGGAAVAAAAAYGSLQVDTVVTFGAPIGATPVPEGTTAVAVQNDSDLVTALGGTHGDDRVVLEATPDLHDITTDRYDPAGQPLSEVAAGGHHPEAYQATAAMLDGSGDDLALAVWDEVADAVGGAESSEAVGFAVER